MASVHKARGPSKQRRPRAWTLFLQLASRVLTVHPQGDRCQRSSLSRAESDSFRAWTVSMHLVATVKSPLSTCMSCASPRNVNGWVLCHCCFQRAMASPSPPALCSFSVHPIPSCPPLTLTFGGCRPMASMAGHNHPPWGYPDLAAVQSGDHEA